MGRRAIEPFPGDLRRRLGRASIIDNCLGYGDVTNADLSCAAEHITHRDDDVILMDGVDTEVHHGFVKCGGVGAMIGMGTICPCETLLQVASPAATPKATPKPTSARELENAFSVLATCDEGVDLVLCFKHLLVMKGHDEHRVNLLGTDALSPSQARVCEAQCHKVNAWFADWSKQGGVIAACM